MLHSTIIEGFRDIPGIAELIGIGRVRQPSDGAQEVEVEVYLASDIDSTSFQPLEHVYCRWVGCGQLDLLVPGTQWRQGRIVGHRTAQAADADYVLARFENIGTGLHPQPPGRRFPSARIARAWGILLQRNAAFSATSSPSEAALDGEADNARRSGPELVLLPAIELVRSLFGVSNGFLLEMFDGIRSPAVSSERGLFDRTRSFVRDDGTVVLMAARHLSHQEAVMAAAIVADPAIGRLYNSVFQQLSVRSHPRSDSEAYLKLAWPWRVPVSMQMSGQWITPPYS